MVVVFTVEWSTSASFKRILGSAQVTETKNPSYTITGLTAVSQTAHTKQTSQQLQILTVNIGILQILYMQTHTLTV